MLDIEESRSLEIRKKSMRLLEVPFEILRLKENSRLSGYRALKGSEMRKFLQRFEINMAPLLENPLWRSISGLMSGGRVDRHEFQSPPKINLLLLNLLRAVSRSEKNSD